MNEVILCMIALFITALACTAGIFSKMYRDNWMQYLSLWCVLAGVMGREWQLWLRLDRWLYDPMMMPAIDLKNHNLALYGGLALFAIGTAWKVWRHREVIVQDGPLQRAELQ